MSSKYEITLGQRLTAKDGDTYYPLCFDVCAGFPKNCTTCDFIKALYNKLGRYEELEEQGRLVKLPCSIGDTTYWIAPEDDTGTKGLFVKKCRPVTGILYTPKGFSVRIQNPNGSYFFNRVGSTDCLLTRNQAEEMLERIRSHG